MILWPGVINFLFKV